VTKTRIRQIPAADVPSEFLDLFFPIHYTVGMRVEEAFCRGVLTRQQAIILWIIRSKGGEKKAMDRKTIEQDMVDWYEITSSAISKAIRSLAKAPLKLVTIVENPESGREKIVALTPKGERFVAQMYEDACAVIKIATDQMAGDEVDMGIHAFGRIRDIFASTPELSRSLQRAMKAAE